MGSPRAPYCSLLNLSDYYMERDLEDAIIVLSIL